MRALRFLRLGALWALSSVLVVLLLPAPCAVADGCDRGVRVVIAPGGWLGEASFEGLATGPIPPNVVPPDGEWGFLDLALVGHSAIVTQGDALDGERYVRLSHVTGVGGFVFAQRTTALTSPLFTGTVGTHYAGVWLRPATGTLPLFILDVTDSNGIDYFLTIDSAGVVTELLPPFYAPVVYPGHIPMQPTVWSAVFFRSGIEITAPFVFLSIGVLSQAGDTAGSWDVDGFWLAATQMPRGVRGGTGQSRRPLFQEWPTDEIAGVLAPFDEYGRDSQGRVVRLGFHDEPDRDRYLAGWVPRTETPPRRPGE